MNVYGELKNAQLEFFTDAGKPAATGANTYRVIYVTDKKQIQVSDGTQWNSSVLSYSLLADRPAASAANAYQTWYTTDDNNLWLSTGSVWQQINGVPADLSVTGNKLDGSTVSWSRELLNVGLSATVAANAMTIALKTRAGTDPTLSDYINMAFRNSTAGTGTYVVRKVSAALSTVISSGSTADSTNGNANWIYVYAIDNAGTVELAWAGTPIADEGSLVSTTAEGGAGAADSKTTLYSTTARSNVACRLIGRIRSTQATAGTWVTAPDEIAVVPFDISRHVDVVWLANGNGFGSSGLSIRRFTNTIMNVGTAMTYADSATNGMSVTVNEDGLYSIFYCDARSTNIGLVVISRNASSLTSSTSGQANGVILGNSTAPTGSQASVAVVAYLYAGDIIRATDDAQANNDTSNRCIFRMVKI